MSTYTHIQRVIKNLLWIKIPIQNVYSCAESNFRITVVSSISTTIHQDNIISTLPTSSYTQKNTRTKSHVPLFQFPSSLCLSSPSTNQYIASLSNKKTSTPSMYVCIPLKAKIQSAKEALKIRGNKSPFWNLRFSTTPSNITLASVRFRSYIRDRHTTTTTMLLSASSV